MSYFQVVRILLLPKKANKLKSKRPIAVDLFAGVGGMSLGFEQAGFDVVAAVEYDPIHAATHSLNFPQTKVICADIARISGEEIRERANLSNRVIDVVFGGPPCQGFSLIGYRVLDDPRNSLVFHFLRLVAELRPRVFVMENVPGMATGTHTGLLDELIGGFQNRGYRVRQPYRILNAANFGVPQDRRRLFLLGATRGVALPEYPEHVTVPRRQSRNGQGKLPLEGSVSCPSVWDAIGDLPDIENFPELLDQDEVAIQLRGGSTYARILRGEIRDPADHSYPRVRDREVVTGCLRAEHTALSRRRFAATPPGETEPVSRFYRLPPDGICNTLRAGTATDRGAFSAPRPIHPNLPRCISVREAARLHSYPDWFRFHRTIWHGFRQIGNSVPPLLGRAVGSSVMRALGTRARKARRTIALGHSGLSSFNMREAAAHFGVDPRIIPPRKRAREVA